jgi:hypothetical protein
VHPPRVITGGITQFESHNKYEFPHLRPIPANCGFYNGLFARFAGIVAIHNSTDSVG